MRLWIEVGFRDPEERVERAMMRVLLLGNVGLACVGLFDLLRLRTERSGVQFAVAILFVLVIVWMDRTRRIYPRALLLVAAVTACATMVTAGLSRNFYWLTDPEPVMFLSTTGVLALILGGKWARGVAIVWSALLVIGVVAARWPASESYGQVVSDAMTVLLILALTFAAVIAVQRVNRQGRAQYEQLMETAPVGIVEMDLRALRDWLFQNGYTTLEQYQSAVENGELHPENVGRRIVLLGYNRMGGEDLLLNKPAGVLDTSDPAGIWSMTNALGSMIYGDSTGTLELTLEVEGTDVYRVINWSAITPDRRSVVVIATDITAQKAAEQALSDQIRYKDEFIASVSHELRTPLTAVVGLVDEMVRTDAPITAAERDELLEIVAEQSHEVADIIEDLLVAARAAGGNLSTTPTECDLGEIIASTLLLFEEAFEYDVEPGSMAFTDPARLRQIMRNLESNAIRYGGDHRRVVARTEGAHAIIEVRDDGSPIAPGRREVIFEAYERTRNKLGSRPESVGLGLTVARSLAETMGGTLIYEHDGIESVFRLTLPHSGSSHHGTDPVARTS
jgi:signal transduction histidine kinase